MVNNMKNHFSPRVLNFSKFDQPGAIYKIDENRVVKRFKKEDRFDFSTFNHEKSILNLVKNVRGFVNMISYHIIDPNKKYFIYERIKDGRVLEDLINEIQYQCDSLTKRRFLHLALQMASRVQYLHEELCILHQDLGMKCWLVHNQS